MIQVVVMSPADFVLSEEAEAFKNTPASTMGYVEDIYRIGVSRAWVVVAVAPNCERKAMASLARDGRVNSFLPTETEYVRRVEVRIVRHRGRDRRQRKTVSKAVERKRFPGYIFAEVPVDDGRRIHAAAHTAITRDDDVRYILGGALGPIPITEQEMTALRQGDACPRVERLLRFHVGETVRIAEGPFRSFNGTVGAINGQQERVKVAVSIFGRATPVELEFDQVEQFV